MRRGKSTAKYVASASRRKRFQGRFVPSDFVFPPGYADDKEEADGDVKQPEEGGTQVSSLVSDEDDSKGPEYDAKEGHSITSRSGELRVEPEALVAVVMEGEDQNRRTKTVSKEQLPSSVIPSAQYGRSGEIIETSILLHFSR